MNQISKSIIAIAILSTSISCNRNADIVRELHYVDLLNSENQSFHKYPNEFSTYLLKGILSDDLKVYYIDYDSSGQILSLHQTIFIQKILEPYEDYSADESTITDAYTMEDVYGILSSVTLLSFDDIMIDEEVHTAYINFYHPGEVTLEGFNKYICSIEYESAIEFLNSKYSPLLWHNYKVDEWGWYNGRLLIPQFETSSRLAQDLIELSDSVVLASRLSDSITFDQAKNLAHDNPFLLNSSLDVDGTGKLTVLFKNDSVSFEIGIFTLEDMVAISKKKNVEDSVIIIPVTTAITRNKLKRLDKIQMISQNGKFERPLRGQDQMSRRAPQSSEVDNIEFPISQKFYFRTVERLIGENPDHLESIPSLLYEGVRNGAITVYRSDTLKSQLLSGEFFDNMILNDQDNVMADTRYLEVYQIITETVFEQSGKIEYQKPVGIGLILPGSQVPEGLNRPIGYFRIEGVNDLLKSINKDEIPMSELKGYPLKSWNVEAFLEN